MATCTTDLGELRTQEAQVPQELHKSIDAIERRFKGTGKDFTVSIYISALPLVNDILCPTTDSHGTRADQLELKSEKGSERLQLEWRVQIVLMNTVLEYVLLYC